MFLSRVKQGNNSIHIGNRSQFVRWNAIRYTTVPSSSLAGDKELLDFLRSRMPSKKKDSVVEKPNLLKDLLDIIDTGLPNRESTQHVSQGWVYRNSLEQTTKSSKKAIFKDKNEINATEEFTLLDHSPLAETVLGETSLHNVPRLAHGLDRVLQSPGVHPLKDFYTSKYNFPVALEDIHPPERINIESFPPFVPSYRDEVLLAMARNNQCKITGSTSSVGPFLSYLYFSVSTLKPVSLQGLSNSVQMQSTNFTNLTLRPVYISILPKDGVYCIKKESNEKLANEILVDLGKTLEKMLTLEAHQFASLLKTSSTPLQFGPENYHYLKVGDCLLRAQIDCCDPNIPGANKSFDLKTRAIAPIRYDLAHYTQQQDRRLIALTGTDLSFEREFYDMVRTSFLRYNFQTRIGRMDGIFLAYHNTRRMLGFEYLSRKEMDKFLFGSSAFGDKCFTAILKLFQHLINYLTDLYPNQHLKLLVRAKGNQELQFFVERPLTSETGYLLPQPTHTNPISGIVELFQVKLEVSLNGEKVLRLLQLDEEDNLSVAVSISKRTDLSQSAINHDYVNLLRSAQ